MPSLFLLWRNMNKEVKISDFIDTEYKDFAYYVINNRAIPSIKDGLKPVQRRILYIGEKEATTFTKVSTFAGSVMKIHPHGNSAIEGAIGTMVQDFCGANNLPFLDGSGAFGCKIIGSGNGIGAARYVSAKLNKFTKDVIFSDREIVEEIDSYDGEFKEVKNYLPYIPIVLLNGVSGIAVGFATEIRPYKLTDILKIQKDIIFGKKITKKSLKPYYKGFKGKVLRNDSGGWKSRGVFEVNKDLLTITELPIGLNREKFISHLNNLIDKEIIRDYSDFSKDEYDIRIKFKKKRAKYSDDQIINIFKLERNLTENLVLIDTNNKLREYNNVIEIIEEFTKWRFPFVKKKYEYLRDKISLEIEDKEELLRFIKFVIKNDYLKKMTRLDRSQIIEDLIDDFPSISKLINISISNFTEDSIEKLEEALLIDKNLLRGYKSTISTSVTQKNKYINELDNIEKSFKRNS